MITVRALTTIDRPVSDVYEYVSDIHQRHVWQLGLIRLKQQERGTGATIMETRRILGRRVEIAGEITENVLNSCLCSRGTGPGDVTFERRWRFEPLDASSTRVTYEVALDTKDAFRLATLTFERVLKRDVESSLGHLKDELEAHEHLHKALSRLPHHADAAAGVAQ